MTKQRIKVVARGSMSFEGYDLDGLSLEDAVDKMSGLLASAGDTKYSFMWNRHDYEDEPSIRLMEEREETDREYQERLRREAEIAAKREEWDRELFEKLKKKYEQEN